jgi:hypothetical protein
MVGGLDGKADESSLSGYFKRMSGYSPHAIRSSDRRSIH